MLTIVLRLAILLHRNRHTQNTPKFTISIKSNAIEIKFLNDWLSNAPLTQTDLEIEADYLKAADYQLTFS